MVGKIGGIPLLIGRISEIDKGGDGFFEYGVFFGLLLGKQDFRNGKGGNHAQEARTISSSANVKPVRRLGGISSGVLNHLDPVSIVWAENLNWAYVDFE